jgi:hypothetical protein
MYPVTVAGRILACACALFGVAISGMLVSVLVEHYQRVYNRKQFSPEQIITAVDSSDGEQEEKQDFINKKLSGLKKNSSMVTLPPVMIPSPKNDRKDSECSTSHVRFIIKITEDQSNDDSKHDTAQELMTELLQTVKNTGEQINLELINGDIDDDSNGDSDDKRRTTN